MTSGDFRRIALTLPEATESAHMGHADFRVGGKIFATLGYPRDGWGMVKLAPEDQAFLIRSHPKAFVPASGAWGRAGCTTVNLKAAGKRVLRDALTIAWRTRAPKHLARALDG